MGKVSSNIRWRFNPVHLGHLIIAECCLEQAHLDRVLFMPAAIPPHKQNSLLADCEDRAQMLRLALAGRDRLEVSLDECNRGGVSYTVDTVNDLVARHQTTTLRSYSDLMLSRTSRYGKTAGNSQYHQDSCD